MLRIGSPLPAETEALATQIIGCAIEVHTVLGPGFREPIYSVALGHELKLRGLPFEREKSLVVDYKGIQITGQRVDLIVQGQILLELKAVRKFERIHEAIVMSYLKSTGLRLGLMINFRRRMLAGGGIKRVVL